MKRILPACTLVLVMAGAVGANDDGGFAYKKAAAVNHLMEYMVKPSMDTVKAYREAGGPSGKEEWQTAFGAVSMVVEAAQLTLMDGRVKDDPWKQGAEEVVAAGRDAMLGAYRMDTDGYAKALKAMSAGCKTCHDVHKKKDE
ncbi:MAG: hypothetical protein OXC19_19015 [Bryobacterales bacterium]|nr:hypothetical protein [Bryobacterales bacterium]